MSCDLQALPAVHNPGGFMHQGKSMAEAGGTLGKTKGNPCGVA